MFDSDHPDISYVDLQDRVTTYRMFSKFYNGLADFLIWLAQHLRKLVKPSVRLTSVEKLAELDAAVNGLADKYLSTRFTALIVAETIANTPLTESLDKSWEAHAYNTITYELYVRVISEICALVSDKIKKTASVRQILRRMRDKELRAALLERQIADIRNQEFNHSGDWTGVDLEEFDRKRKEEDIADRIDWFEKTWDAIENRTDLLSLPVVDRFTKARNQLINHHDIGAEANRAPVRFSPTDFGLTWGEPIQYLNDVEAYIFDIVLLVTSTSYGPDEWNSIYSTYAKTFWERFRLGPKQNFHDLRGEVL